MSAVLEIHNLVGGYLPGVDILKGIDLEIQDGEAVGIIGLNGSGKSTLGKAIMNMIPYRSGRIIFNGEDISSLSSAELSRKGIAIFQQGGRVFGELSVWENLQLALGDRGKLSDIEELQSLIPLLNADKRTLMRQKADKLSGGQRHQLALAMCLLQKPKLLILDEPSAGLSPALSLLFHNIMKKNFDKYKISILLIEQKIGLIITFCCKLFVVEKCMLKNIIVKNYRINHL